MTDVLESAWQTVSTFIAGVWSALEAAAAGLGPLEWGLLTTALLLALLITLLLRRRRSEPHQSRPEVLISLGAIGAAEGFDPESGVMLPKRFRLKMTVTNLNTYPMQALELALKTPEMELPVTAELAALIPPESSVVVEETLSELVGDEGKLNLYLYAANNSKKTYRLQTAFALEPWNERYKISPLGQNIAVTRQLASAGVSRVRERAWREREKGRVHGTRSQAPPAQGLGELGSTWRRPSPRREREGDAHRPRERARADGRTGTTRAESAGVQVYERPEDLDAQGDAQRERMSFPDEF